MESTDQLAVQKLTIAEAALEVERRENLTVAEDTFLDRPDRSLLHRKHLSCEAYLGHAVTLPHHRQSFVHLRLQIGPVK